MDIRDLYRQFEKQELLDVAEQLEIPSDGSAKVLTQRILDDIKASGVPEANECSDLVFEFLVAAEIIDEDGNTIEKEEKEEEETDTLPDNLPECYTFADRRDPACQRCRVVKVCEEQRISNRPECFGLLHSDVAEECKVCIEAPQCSVIVKGDNQDG
jgi:hypothetical protein